MMRLNDWQARLQQSILERENHLDGLLEGKELQQTTGLSIYQDGYLLRLAETLKDNYPVLFLLLGNTEFGQLFLGYHGIYPSKHPSLRWFGSQLSQYLRHDSIYVDRPALSELADFEWAIHHTIDAADSTPVAFDTLAALLPEEWSKLTFRLHPSSRVLQYQWDVPTFWQSIQDGAIAPAESRLENSWLIFRALDRSSHWRTLDNLEHRMLLCIEAGVEFGDLCQQVAVWTDSPDEAPSIVARLLRRLVEDGLLVLD